MAAAKGKPKGLLLAIAGDDEPPSSKGGDGEAPPSSKAGAKPGAFEEAADSAFAAILAEDKAAFREALMAAVYACSED